MSLVTSIAFTEIRGLNKINCIEKQNRNNVPMNIYPILEDILSSSPCFFSPTASTFSSVDTGFSAYLNELVSALLSHQKATVTSSGELDFRVRDAIRVLPFHYEHSVKLN